MSERMKPERLVMTIIEPPKTRCPRCGWKEYQEDFCNNCLRGPLKWGWLKWWLVGALFFGLIIWNVK